MGKLAAILIKLAIAGGSFFAGFFGKVISVFFFLWTLSDVITVLEMLG